MAEEDHPDGDGDHFPVSEPLLTSPIQVVRIAQDVPIIFADGVLSQWYSPGGVCKFHLGRIEPDPRAAADPKEVPVLQIVMPTEGFVAMVAFFEQRLRVMLEANVVTSDQIARARELWAKK